MPDHAKRLAWMKRHLHARHSTTARKQDPVNSLWHQWMILVQITSILLLNLKNGVLKTWLCTRELISFQNAVLPSKTVEIPGLSPSRVVAISTLSTQHFLKHHISKLNFNAKMSGLMLSPWRHLQDQWLLLFSLSSDYQVNKISN